MLISGRRHLQAGFNLVELMVVVAILGFLLAAGLPLIAEGLRDSRVRASAESVVSGLRIAQSEALKRNGPYRFQLVTSLSDSCAIAASGTAWVASASPATGKCNVSDIMADPFPIRREGGLDTGSVAVEANGNGVFCFSGLGRPTTTPTGCNATAAQTIDFRLPGYTCKASGGDARCLRVVVSTSGSVRMCDPAVNAIGDPRTC